MKIQWLVLSVILGVGCANASTVTEKSPVTQDLSAYRTATIVVTVSDGVDKPDAFKSLLGTFLDAKLKEQKLFADVVAEGGDLTLKVNITKLDKAASIAGIPAGETDATASVELFDAKASKALGAFEITASSRQSSNVSVNGVRTTAADDPRNRAIRATSDRIAAYIETHRGAAK